MTVPQSCTTTYLWDRDHQRGGIDLDNQWRGRRSRSRRAAARSIASIPGRVSGAWLDRATHRIGAHRKLAEPYDFPGTPTIETSPFSMTRSSSAHSKNLGGKLHIF